MAKRVRSKDDANIQIRVTGGGPRKSHVTKSNGACKVGSRRTIRGKKVKGTFCVETKTPLKKLTKASLRWKKSPKGKAWLVVGCPKGKWKPRAKRCAVGLKVYQIHRRAAAK